MGRINFEKLIKGGENPNGTTVQTANGTAHAGNDPGWNRVYNYEKPRAEKTGTWRRANRTGE